MDCKTARVVWNHPDGFIAGINVAMPGVIERLTGYVAEFVSGTTNAFHETVKSESGVTGNYLTHHAEDDDQIAEWAHDVIGDAAGSIKLNQYFTDLFGTPVQLRNICCSGCDISDGQQSDEDILAIQHAAVNIEPDGSLYQAA